MPPARVSLFGSVRSAMSITRTARVAFWNQVPSSTPFEAGRGDVLLLLTDGLLEVFDRSDVEFGLSGVTGILRSRATEPLPAIADALRDAVRSHGPQTDDQTLLLLRVR